MKYKVGERIKFIEDEGGFNYETKEGTIVKKNLKFFSASEYFVQLDDNEKVIIIYKTDIIRNCLPVPKIKISMPECKSPKTDNISELYKWLKGERHGYLLEDHKTWINYGSLNDKFPYDENDKQRELSRNHMIYKTIRKMKELDLIDMESEE